MFNPPIATCPMYADTLADAKEEMKGEFFPGKTIMTLQVANGNIDPNAKTPIAVKHETVSINGKNGTLLLENPRGMKTNKVYLSGVEKSNTGERYLNS